MNYFSIITVGKRYSLCSLLHDSNNVQKLLLLMLALCIDLIPFMYMGRRYTYLLHGIFIGTLFGSTRSATSLSLFSRAMIVLICLCNLILACIEQHTVAHEIYLLTTLYLCIAIIAPHIVSTEFAQRAVIATLLISMISMSSLLQTSVSSLSTIGIRLISTLTILLPFIP